MQCFIIMPFKKEFNQIYNIYVEICQSKKKLKRNELIPMVKLI